MHALIIGATGATGLALLSQLLADDSVTQVSIFVRKPVAIIDKQISHDDRLQLAMSWVLMWWIIQAHSMSCTPSLVSCMSAIY